MDRRHKLVHVITVHRTAKGIQGVAWTPSDVSHFLFPTESPLLADAEELTRWVLEVLRSQRRHRVNILLSPALRADAALLGAVTQAVGAAQAQAVERRRTSAAAG